MGETIREYVIRQLRTGTACANTFYRDAKPTARNRISELRNNGWQITTMACDLHSHEQPVVKYVLIAEPTNQLIFGGTG